MTRTPGVGGQERRGCRSRPWHSNLIRLTVVFGGLPLPIVLYENWGDSRARAILSMAVGLYAIWCVGATWLIWRWRDAVRERFLRAPGNPWLKFFLLCLALVLLEEAVTTTMTNLAPVFGSEVGVAYITGSANYLEVVLWHSVVAIFPGFIAWALLVRWVAVHPNTAYLVYGLQGVMGEVMYDGPHQAAAFAFWIAVYGPILYLPTYCVYGLGARRRPRLGHFAAVFALSIVLTIPSVQFVFRFRPPDAGFPEVLERTTRPRGTPEPGSDGAGALPNL
ncbi:MAG: hypothetical protein SNJ74_06505 [Fimbriimonadaceae bacterium]